MLVETMNYVWCAVGFCGGVLFATTCTTFAAILDTAHAEERARKKREEYRAYALSVQKKEEKYE